MVERVSYLFVRGKAVGGGDGDSDSDGDGGVAVQMNSLSAIRESDLIDQFISNFFPGGSVRQNFF